MKPTNYHLFDFLDFDTELSRNESLWKAYKPTAVYEKEGDIYVTVPFQKQKLANDMMADTDVPQEEYTLIIRQYNIGITRLFLGFGDYVLTDESEMLQFSDRIQKVPLFIKEQKGKWILSTEDGTKRAIINVEEPLLDRWSELLPDPQETLDITLYPDGKREIRLSAYDHFSPPRYDALPVAFCKRDGRKERATLSFECKPDECFAGTGERFFKMDLSGQTFFLKNQYPLSSCVLSCWLEVVASSRATHRRQSQSHSRLLLFLLLSESHSNSYFHSRVRQPILLYGRCFSEHMILTL